MFRTASHRCAVHEHLGHDALPLACRQFPRVSVHDPRGVSITLSHYCPTASTLIQSAGYGGHVGCGNDGGDIVINPPAFPPGGEYVGLDARGALPPLLRRDLLMDWDAWWHLEDRAVATLLHRGSSAGDAVAMLRAVVARLGRWRPGGQPLLDAVDSAFEEGDSAPEALPAGTLVKRVLDSVPEPYRERASWSVYAGTPDLVTRRFLAAHAFANWRVHEQDGGLPAWLESIETARAFLSEGAGIQQADLVLRHLSE